MIRFATLIRGVFAVSFAGLTITTLAHAQGKNPVVVLETNKGNIVIELFADKAPITVENFLKYVDSGHYDNTIFHRVIGPNPRQPQGFMIQGGGFENLNPPAEKQGGKPIKNEGGNGLKNNRGTLAMARTSAPDSATAQFFINLSDNNQLNRESASDGYGYAVFGNVTDGMDVVDAIAKVETAEAVVKARDQGNQLATATFQDVPSKPVIIKSIKRKTNG
jgi:cyclophilin family peptidyl-prolyl cis-trans isomerase